MTDQAPRFRKGVYRLGEAAQLTGLEGHVLRYWESEFPQLSPRKSPGGQRLYTPADLAVVLRIKDLLYVRGFTIAGARRELEDDTAPSASASEPLVEARDEIRSILTLLEAGDTL